MKKILLIAALALCGVGAFAQEEVNELTNRQSRLGREYLRPSLTTIYVHDASQTAAEAVEVLKTNVDRKFDINSVKVNTFTSDQVAGDETQRKAVIESIIASEKLGNQIMKNWFPKFDSNSGYTIEVLEERGQFAATDNDVLEANASARQSSMFELGERLIDRSYLMVYFVSDASYTNKKGERVTQARVTPYVYKLDFNAEVMNAFYGQYYTVADGIDKCEFPLVYTAHGESVDMLKTSSGYDSTGAYEDLMHNVKHVNDFMVKSPVAKTMPICAKLGTKEGLQVDKRFDVIELREKKDGTLYEKRIACTRVRKVASNDTIATGDSENYSKFYQFKGLKVREGQVLVENPDRGVSIGADIATSDVSITADYRLGKHFGVPGLLLGLNVGVVATSKEFKALHMVGDGDYYYLVNSNGDPLKSPILKAGLNIAKEFNFFRNLVFTPQIAAGVYFPTIKDNNDEFIMDAYYVGASVKLGYMITHNSQLFVEAGYNYNITGEIFETYVKEENMPNPLKIGLGFKVYF